MGGSHTESNNESLVSSMEGVRKTVDPADLFPDFVVAVFSGSINAMLATGNVLGASNCRLEPREARIAAAFQNVVSYKN